MLHCRCLIALSDSVFLCLVSGMIKNNQRTVANVFSPRSLERIIWSRKHGQGRRSSQNSDNNIKSKISWEKTVKLIKEGKQNIFSIYCAIKAYTHVAHVYMPLLNGLLFCHFNFEFRKEMKSVSHHIYSPREQQAIYCFFLSSLTHQLKKVND